MKLVSWILCTALQVALFKLDCLSALNLLAEKTYQQCEIFIRSHPSSWNWLYEALLIGNQDNVREHPLLQSFLILGIYHLIVVSGSHVQSVHHWTRRCTFFLPKNIAGTVIMMALMLFALANRLQAACMRALFHFIISKFYRPSVLLQADLQFVVTCICLLLRPEWVASLSFQLSCAASLGLTIADSFTIKSAFRKRTVQALTCTLAMAPLLFAIQPCLSWLIMPANILAAPLFELVLVPLCALNVFLPFVRIVTEPFLVLVFKFTSLISQFENPTLCFDERRMKIWGFVYITFVYFCWRLFLPVLARVSFWKSQRSPHHN
jgi:ComEC/Rec2-related protein